MLNMFARFLLFTPFGPLVLRFCRRTGAREALPKSARYSQCEAT